MEHGFVCINAFKNVNKITELTYSEHFISITMITSKRKRDGPSKLSLKSSQKYLSQTQKSSTLDPKEIVSQLSRR